MKWNVNFGIDADGEDVMIRHAVHRDCMNCGGSGYFGRTGVYEIMPMSPALRRVISKGDNAANIEKVALEEGMKTLRMAAIDKVLRYNDD